MEQPMTSCSHSKGFLTMKVVYQACYSIDVHKSFLVATIIRTTSGIAPYHMKASPPPTILSRSSKTSLLKTSVAIPVWNPRVNTGLQYSTFWRTISTSPLPTPNGLKQSTATKMTRKIPDKSGICFN